MRTYPVCTNTDCECEINPNAYDDCDYTYSGLCKECAKKEILEQMRIDFEMVCRLLGYEVVEVI